MATKQPVLYAYSPKFAQQGEIVKAKRPAETHLRRRRARALRRRSGCVQRDARRLHRPRRAGIGPGCRPCWRRSHRSSSGATR
ncbi:MAG: hypothetical protein U1F25_17805 [Rubrivivax sp.]